MYRFLDHPSEAMIEVTANSEEEVFRDAAVALFEVMTDASKVQPSIEFRIALKSNDRNGLLIDWLNRLIWLHEVEKVFLTQFEVHLHRNEFWGLEATAHGEKIRGDSERRSGVKSATYGMFEWEETGSNHRVRFVLDI